MKENTGKIQKDIPNILSLTQSECNNVCICRIDKLRSVIARRMQLTANKLNVNYFK